MSGEAEFKLKIIGQDQEGPFRINRLQLTTNVSVMNTYVPSTIQPVHSENFGRPRKCIKVTVLIEDF